MEGLSDIIWACKHYKKEMEKVISEEEEGEFHTNSKNRKHLRKNRSRQGLYHADNYFWVQKKAIMRL